MKAIRFNSEGTLYWDNVPGITFPLTIGCLLAPGALSSTSPQVFMGLTVPTSTQANNFFTLGLEGGAVGAPNLNAYSIRMSGLTGSLEVAILPPAPALNVWELCMVVLANANDAYYHSPSKNPTVPDTSGVTNMAGTSFTRVTLGSGLRSIGAISHATGHVESPFVYRRALTRADYTKLASGLSPEDLYPKDLAFHVPNLYNYLDGNLPNWYGGQPATVLGTMPVTRLVDVPRTNYPFA